MMAVLALVVGACGSGRSGALDNAAGTPVPTAPPFPPVFSGPPPPVAWRACGGGFQCASIPAPLDYRHPDGPTVTLAAVRLPATGPRRGTLAVNYGGPGTPGTTSLRRLSARFAGLRASFDVIAVDPRGTGGTTPVRCGRFDEEPAMPVGPVGTPAFWDSAAAPGRECRTATGEALRHMSSATTARDLDLVRQEMGEPTLSLYGYSYGTYAMSTYANLFPQNTRAMVLDGTLDLAANAGSGSDSRPVDVRAGVAPAWEETLGSVLDGCAAAGPAQCSLARTGDPRTRTTDITAALARGPIEGVSAAELTERVDKALQTAGRLPGMLRTLASLPAPPSGGVVRPAPAPWVPTHSSSFLAVQCTDSITPSAAAVDDAVRSEGAAHPMFGASAALNTAMCVGWPAVDPDRYLGPWNARLGAPTLVINSRFDPATPLRDARATAGELAAARVLVVEAVGHTTLDAPSRCAQDAATAYIVDPSALPADGTTCPAGFG